MGCYLLINVGKWGWEWGKSGICGLGNGANEGEGLMKASDPNAVHRGLISGIVSLSLVWHWWRLTRRNLIYDQYYRAVCLMGEGPRNGCWSVLCTEILTI